MFHNWVRIFGFAVFAAFLVIALIALQSPQTTSATEFKPASPTVLFVESDSECGSDTNDDNGNVLVNEGCPTEFPKTAETLCADALDNDPGSIGIDGKVNDGCPQSGASKELAAQCDNATDDDVADSDGLINDGCPAVGNPETGSDCLNNTNDDASTSDTLVNDGCPGVPRVGTSATPDTTALFDVPIPSAQFSGAIAFTDPAFTVDEHGAGADLPIGAIVGLVDSQATLGLVNGSCSTVLPVPITMMNASIDTSDTIDTDGPPDNLLLPLAEDANNNKLPDVADRYPLYLNTIFEKGDGTPLEPRFRYVGVQDVAGLIVILNLVGFDAGELRKVPGGGGAVSRLGTPVVTVLQNPTQATSNSAISDFCAKLQTNVNLLGVSNDNDCTAAAPAAGCTLSVSTSLGLRDIFKGVDGGSSHTTPNEAGFTRLTAPASPGTTSSVQMYGSQRDFDGDGIENSLDACHSTWSDLDGVPDGDPSDNWDPRAVTNFLTDKDGDGLDVSCDPNDSIIGPPPGLNTDQDGDAYLNRLDNCALVANGDTKVAGNASSGTIIEVDSTAGFTVGNEVQLSTGVSAERFTITGILSGPPRFTLSTAITKSHLVLDPAAQIFPQNVNIGASDVDILFPGTVPDGGPRSDAIGPPCDSGVTIDGETLSPTLPNGHYHRTATISRGCVLGTDADGDGVCAGFIQIPAIGSAETAGAQCADAIDNDGDGAAGDGCLEDDTTSDTDGDGVPDGLDNCLNTDNVAPAGFTQEDVDADGIGDACETVNSTTNTNDNDGDGFSNTLEGVEQPTGSGLAGLSECGNAIDDDGDGDINDGCPAWGAPETACSDAVDSDRDLFVNDGCIGDPSFAVTAEFKDTNPDTIVRTTGSWITDGFAAGETLMVAGTTSNNGFFLIDSVTALTLTLAFPVETLTNEAPSSASFSDRADGEESSGTGTGIELHCATNSLDTIGSYPPDIDGVGGITSGDLSFIAGPIGTSTVAGGGSTPDRRDIAPEPVSDNSISSADLSAVAAFIGTGC